LKNFDEKIRDKLYNAEMPVADGIWEAIEQNIEKRGNRINYWLLLLVLLLALPSTLLYLYYSDTLETNENIALEFSGTQADSNNDLIENLRQPLSAFKQIDTKSPHFVSSTRTGHNKNLGFQIASGQKTRKASNNNETNNHAPTLHTAHKIEKATQILNIGTTNQKIQLPKLFSQGTECPDFRQPWPGLYSYVNLTTAYPFSSLASGGAEMTDLISARSMTESPLPSFTAEMGLGYDFHSGFFVESGIRYNQINIKFSHREEDIINNTTSIIIDTTFNGQGEVIAINRDTSVVQEIGVREITNTNHFNFIDIPLSIGYNYRLSTKINMRASAGLVMNLRMRSKGYMLDHYEQAFMYGHGESSMFKTRVALSYTAGLMFETELNEKIIAGAGMRMQYMPGNINLNTNPVDQSFLTIGISAGLRYRI
jgi:hypothetical protein